LLTPRSGFLRDIFEGQADLQTPGVRGTLWGAYNAVTRFEDYKQPQQEETQDQRLERTWFGGGAEIKLKAWTAVLEALGNCFNSSALRIQTIQTHGMYPHAFSKGNQLAKAGFPVFCLFGEGFGERSLVRIVKTRPSS
jgi:hypothetical protein